MSTKLELYGKPCKIIMPNENNTDQQDEIIGKQLARVLGLKPLKEYNKEGNIRFDTSGGNKTYIGLARTVQAILDGKYSN